ncbi:MAG: hypothetical protein NVS9B10_29190 [Nevskia sp.]
MESRVVTRADGSTRLVPVIRPVTIEFENRSYMTEASVLGDEPLIGCIPIEAMDVIVDPRSQEMVVNPAHPNFAVAVVKSPVPPAMRPGLRAAPLAEKKPAATRVRSDRSAPTTSYETGRP